MMVREQEKRFPANSNDYKLFEKIGEGVSATVYRALCIPLNKTVAIKILDLEKCSRDLDGVRHEVRTMSLVDHPNVLHAHCSFTSGHMLWVVMPFMAGGSCLHIMKSAYPEGFDEPVIATLLREVLKALVYLHGHGHIHRDVKAGNVLINSDGTVKLADFGVSACMFDTGNRQRSQNTFAGTPCWMAPEVMQQLNGYNFKADIWSFGIMALELAHGHAPFSKYPLMKVLLMTLQNSPPGLDYERDKRFTKTFKDMVATCLAKDPKKRPTSEKLLRHAFFTNAHSKEYLVRTILDSLPPLGDHFRRQKGKEVDFLLQNKALCGGKEQLSQQEFIRGISGWNFDLEELKTQASLIKSSDDNSEDRDMNHKLKDGHDEVDYTREALSTERVSQDSNASSREVLSLDQISFSLFSSALIIFKPLSHFSRFSDISLFLGWASRSSGIGRSICLFIFTSSSSGTRSNAESEVPWEPSSIAEDLNAGNNSGGNGGKKNPVFQNIDVLGCQNFLSGSLLPERILLLHKNSEMDAEREQKYKCERNHSGPLSYRHMRGFHTYTSANMHDESSGGLVIQRKGRFKVTSSDAGLKEEPLVDYLINEVGGVSAIPTVDTAAVLPSLQYLLQQNAMQKEQLIKLIRCLEQTYTNQMEHPDAGNTSLLQLPLACTRERRLQSYAVHLEQSIRSLTEELQILNMKNSQLERQLKGSCKKGEDEKMWNENISAKG
ncbi:serine/threonine-protein kinase BLUS1-like isoform X3 [Phoenix dactylifera]|uniref:Serine/threonine-protein kinase BLUS1-like isoform X3 n=1 Tax=Phoenix dactylifera TaxID=42345 RepID=A0A8B9APH0_PHODC|nr:serine/threonine-protein kinase BLUS1-like isoform X3 [Phoenix dactylifera]